MPFWIVTRRAVSAARDSSSVANRSSASARCLECQLDQPVGSSNARRAEATALSMSRVVAAGTLPIGSSVAGAQTVIVASPARRCQPPSM